jgi:hypothetical protein
VTLDAVRSEAIAAVRAAVPEFEDAFQAELREEEGQLGSFQAMSVFARWTLERLQSDPGSDAVPRAFQVVERLIADNTLELGDALAGEFIEIVWDVPAAVELMGELTRERAEPTHP